MGTASQLCAPLFVAHHAGSRDLVVLSIWNTLTKQGRVESRYVGDFTELRHPDDAQVWSLLLHPVFVALRVLGNFVGVQRRQWHAGLSPKEEEWPSFIVHRSNRVHTTHPDGLLARPRCTF
jgi:hypothetical protein